MRLLKPAPIAFLRLDSPLSYLLFVLQPLFIFCFPFSGSGEDIESILALADSKCKPKSAAASDGAEDSGSNALEDALATCDTTGMDSKVRK